MTQPGSHIESCRTKRESDRRTLSGDFFNESASPRVVVIGIGQHHRGDDAAGLLVARAINAQGITSLRTYEISGDVTALVPLLDGADAAWIIDTVLGPDLPGEIMRYDLRRDSLPANVSVRTTHALGIVHALELARITAQLPPLLILFGIAGNRFDMNTPPCPPVRKAIARVAQTVCMEVNTYCTTDR